MFFQQYTPGATIAVLCLMEYKGFRGTLMNGYVSATKRSQELRKRS